MHKIRHLLSQTFTTLLTVLMIGMFPATAYAEPAAQADQQTTPQASNGPTGSDGIAYHFNESSGLWENDYYTYNPATKEKTPKTPLEYVYNPETKKWDCTMWQWVSSANAYQQGTFSLDTPPAGAITRGGPTSQTPTDPLPEQTSGVAKNSDVVQKTTSSEGSSPAINGADSNIPSKNTLSNNPDSNVTGSNTSTGTLTNNHTLDAATGNAAVVNNDNVGGVATGNANDTANIVNLLQTQASFAGAGLPTFTANIQGNLSGDFQIDPANFSQPASMNPMNLATATLTNKNSGTIANNINLNATSGNADAINNNAVGAVTTGNANAVADVINMINSVVAANQSFMGVINIYGDYSGNILMPADSLNGLLSSGGTSTPASNTITNNTNENVNNNVNLAANTGIAKVSNNDTVGKVATGNGLTNLTILNLTGKHVIAANSLLVFVNVLGSWVGLIMDAPAGSTSAALGGGVTGNVNVGNPPIFTASNANSFGITNNITANANSGNAKAVNNNNVGSIATGNASSSANIANIINSNFALSNWFGVLFINVFGNWHGNFGVAKPPVIPSVHSYLAGLGGGVAKSGIQDVKVFAFVPKAAPGTSEHTSGFGLTQLPQKSSGGGTALSSNETKQPGQVLAARHKNSTIPPSALQQTVAANSNYPSFLLLGLGTIGFGFIGVERVRNNLRNKTFNRA